MPTRRTPSLVWIGSALALVLVLGACTPGGQFDPTEVLSSDIFSTKKKLAGEREPLFPNGVPGTETGVPPDLVKGYQPPPEQQQSADNAEIPPAPKPAAIPATSKPKHKPKPKSKPAVAHAPASSPAQAPVSAAHDPAWDQAPSSAPVSGRTIRLGIGRRRRRKPLNRLGRARRKRRRRKPTGPRRGSMRSLPGRRRLRAKPSRPRSLRNRTSRIHRHPAPIHAIRVGIESGMRRLCAASLLALAVR